MAPARTNPPRGGVGTRETPATNTGSGSGLGDSGYPKGSGPTTGQFTTLANQKGTSRDNDESFFEEPPNPSEDRSFMAHKPGHPETLPGWDKLKDVIGYTS
ncbi:uncharacterized protein ASPGLDRAFT_53511 [Aspergillus glaucus CBS 516.65]|uniref:Uncharacterized protein n=1 Tax=Aspergillus glaucus CBS 516.65 TaxID=1160497 RepID=A0A1L9V3T4_ASPGL|nr:hypothetical protein ASPGLDRAFT_53511 [Aspergillus glaucus CBS 516.65]OJJ78580.1 hypothetical protein ASPGLDRAFT_53511 [Aspergillus glaucus CBS 516.65]